VKAEFRGSIPSASATAGGPYQPAGSGIYFDYKRVHVAAGSGRGVHARKIRRIGVASEIDVTGAVQGDAVAVVRSGAAKIRNLGHLRRCAKSTAE
jgi:hypothetical protein